MKDYSAILRLYQDCLYEIKKRIEVIADHINKATTEKYLIIEVETVCLQFRKILEKTALMSLVANKDLYAAQNESFAKHYHAERIMRDLERINPKFYPVPVKRVETDGGYDDLTELEEGYLTKEEFVKLYEKCGGMMHAQNPFASVKAPEEYQAEFPKWLTKICLLLNHHIITLADEGIMLVALMERKDNGLPQAVIFERM